MRGSWRWYLGVAMAACVGYFVLPVAWGTLAFLVIAVSGVVAVCVGVHHYRPGRATTTWRWLVAARVLWVVGDGLYLFYLEVLHQEPYPSPGDVAYLVGYAALMVGLLLLIRQRTPGTDRASLVDATIVASGIGLLVWVFLVEPAATDTQTSVLIRLTTTAYPMLDLLLLALLDLDHFKRFNDTYGHQMGDQLLKDAVAAWKSRLRRGDVLARYGGEEFVVLLPQASLDHAYEVVERLREAMPLDQSFSAGLAVWDRQEPSDALLARADAALYAAKDAGRDQVVLAPTG
jgi:diguanylate cyclase (GGDEF)-like protein